MSDPFESLRNDAFSKLGRNIALFQQLESGLKQFIGIRVIEGSTEDDVRRFLKGRQDEVAQKSLGQVVGHFFEDMAKDEGEEPGELPPGTPGWFRTRFKIEGDEYLTAKRQGLKVLVDERNRLVHHLSEDFNLKTADGIAGLALLLDAQAERIRTELRDLATLFRDLGRARQRVQEQLESPEVQEWIAALPNERET